MVIVSLALRAPVVKSVHDTLTVNDAPRIPVELTVTEPSCAERLVVPVAAEPRLAEAGTLMDRAASASEGVEMMNSVATTTKKPTRQPTFTHSPCLPCCRNTKLPGP